MDSMDKPDTKNTIYKIYKLYIQETFYGLQGEGNKMGYPSVFVRLGGCNLKCEGFGCEIESPKTGETLIGCDTIYAANTKHFFETWDECDSWEDLVLGINYLFPPELLYTDEKIDIVFTGGEPLLHHKNPILLKTVEYFISRGHEVWFETNGTIPIDFNEFSIYRKCHFSMSIKMALSGEPVEKRWMTGVVNAYIKNTTKSYFKFVMSDSNITNEGEEIFDFLHMIPTYAPVYCMPLGSTQTELTDNAKTVYEFAARNGFRFSDRLQIRIHNDKQGV